METNEQRLSYTHGNRVVYGELVISLINVSLSRVRKLLKPQPVTEQTLIDEAGNPYQTLLFTKMGRLPLSETGAASPYDVSVMKYGLIFQMGFALKWSSRYGCPVLTLLAIPFRAFTTASSAPAWHHLPMW